jgi:hypothetical protein
MTLVMTWGLLMTLGLINTFKPILSNPTVWGPIWGGFKFQ